MRPLAAGSGRVHVHAAAWRPGTCSGPRAPGPAGGRGSSPAPTPLAASSDEVTPRKRVSRVKAARDGHGGVRGRGRNPRACADGRARGQSVRRRQPEAGRPGRGVKGRGAKGRWVVGGSRP